MDSKFNKITPNVTLYTLRNTKKNIFRIYNHFLTFFRKSKVTIYDNTL